MLKIERADPADLDLILFTVPRDLMSQAKSSTITCDVIAQVLLPVRNEMVWKRVGDPAAIALVKRQNKSLHYCA